MFVSVFLGNFSVLDLRFVFTRRIGHYLTRVYIPAILIVSMSWLSFFIDPTSVPARVALSIMTVLTMTTLLRSGIFARGIVCEGGRLVPDFLLHFCVRCICRICDCKQHTNRTQIYRAANGKNECIFRKNKHVIISELLLQSTTS